MNPKLFMEIEKPLQIGLDVVFLYSGPDNFICKRLPARMVGRNIREGFGVQPALEATISRQVDCLHELPDAMFGAEGVQSLGVAAYIEYSLQLGFFDSVGIRQVFDAVFRAAILGQQAVLVVENPSDGAGYCSGGRVGAVGG